MSKGMLLIRDIEKSFKMYGYFVLFSFGIITSYFTPFFDIIYLISHTHIEQGVLDSITGYQWDEEPQETIFFGKGIISLEKET